MVDFLSDVHLDAGEVATFNAWANHLNTTPANALFILGDLFEVWIGDDTQDPFHLQCMEVLRNNVKRIPVFLCAVTAISWWDRIGYDLPACKACKTLAF